MKRTIRLRSETLRLLIGADLRLIAAGRPNVPGYTVHHAALSW